MSMSGGDSNNNASSNLRPGWNRSGFQPPPPAGEQQQRSTSSRGRSLADLARSSGPTGPSSSSTNNASSTNGGNTPRWPSKKSPSSGPRYTRAKLLALRPPTCDTPPAALAAEICADAAQDPVCWDSFVDDEEAIWNSVRLRKSSSTERGSHRWQRGVALPTETAATSSKPSNAEDLWDDPGEELDFAKMAEASAQMEQELRGGTSKEAEATVSSLNASSTPPPPEETSGASNTATTFGGLTTTTTNIGSGENVNVFEDEDDDVELPMPPPPVEVPNETATVVSVEEPAPAAPPEPVIQKAGTDSSLDESSRLMAMIGVSKPVNEESSLWGTSTTSATAALSSASVPLNPWGTPSITTPSLAPPNDVAKALEQERLREQEMIRMQQEQARREEHARREREQRVRREQEQAAAAAAAAANPSEVELVLMERICTILENQWGHSDMVSILNLLHSEDSRVIALLSSVDALRALISRHPHRVEIRVDPAMRTEVAQLRLTNAQYRQEQERQRREQLMQEELQRRRLLAEEQKRLQQQQQQQQQRQMSAAASMTSHSSIPPIDATAPWYYSDPSRNIQGPFRSEEMRQWLEAGYFKGDLPISQNPTGPFVPLSIYFPTISLAFKVEARPPTPTPPPPEPSSLPVESVPLQKITSSAPALASVSMEESLSVEEHQHPAPQPVPTSTNTTKSVAPSSQPPEHKNNHHDTENNNASSSDQLKMMLGLGNGNGNSPKVAPTPAAPAPSATKKTTTPAWGGGVTKPMTRKSMSEIQQEEAAAAAKRGGNNNKNGSGGWAKIAASSSAWTGPAAPPSKPQRPGNGPTRSASLAIHNQHPARPQKPGRSKSSSEAAGGAAFGAKLPQGLESWAKEQMKRLNGTEDLTLVSFCMSLQDPDEIHQYLTVYLGESKEVSQFANELIARKADDWESTATTRKGRKSKK